MARSLLSGVLSIAGGKVGSMMIGAIATPLLVRFLGAAEYGRYAVVLSVFAFANIVMTSGTNDAVRKFISEREDAEWQNAVFGALARPAAVLAAVVAAAFLAGATSGLVERALGPGYVPLFYLLALYAVGRQCREYLLRALMGLRAETYSEPIRVFQRGLFAALAVTAAYLGYDVEGVLVADIATSAVVTAIAGAALSRFVDVRSLLSTPVVDLPRSEMYPYIGSTVLFFGFLTSLYHVDVLLLQVWLPETSVGHYKGALIIAEILWFGPAAIQLALLQRVSGLWADGDVDAIQRRAARTTRYALLFTLLAATGMAALATDFVPLYLGREFSPAVEPLLLLLPGVVGFAAARPTLAINQGRRSLRPLILATGGCAAVNLALNAVLIPQYGMTGAAVATSIGYGSLAGFQALAARHIGYEPFRDLPVARVAATAVLGAVPIFGTSWLISSSFVALAVVPPVGLVAFCLAAVLTGAVETREVRAIVGRLRATAG